MGRGVRAMSLSQMDCGRCQAIGVQICWWIVHEMPLFTLKVGKLQKLWWREVCRGNRTIVIAVYERVQCLRTSCVAVGVLRD